MGLVEEYSKQIKTQLIDVCVTRWTAGAKPSVDPPWYGDEYDYHPDVISCSMSFGYDQGSSNCSIIIKTPYDGSNPIIFDPMDKVVIKQGWNNSDTLQTTFFGFVDSVTLENFPRLQTLKCRDILKLAQNFYIVHSNRKVYTSEDWDDDEKFWPAQPEFERYAEVIIADLLEYSGIPSSRHDFVQMEYYVGDTPVHIVIANNNYWVIEYQSALDAVNSICDLLGYRIWATPDGMVKLRYARPFASVDYSQEYTTISGHLLRIGADVTDEDLRNRIEVRGYDYGEGAGGQVYVVKYADSDYVPDPPKYRRAEVVSDLIDIDAMAEWIASGVLRDLNRLKYSANVSIEGDPRLQIGQTVKIIDPYAASGINYFVYDYSARVSSSDYTNELSLVGGLDVGSDPNELVEPIAAFDYTVVSGTSLTVYCDATIAYDPDGSISNYLWECSGYGNQTDVTADFYVSDPSSITSITVNLTVTDLDSLQDSSAQIIAWSGI